MTHHARGSRSALIRPSARVAVLALVMAGMLVIGPARVALSAAARTGPAPRSLVAAGTNLLGNSRGTVGDTSAQGWDAVTIPGWQVAAGLPTIVRYGTAGFPKAKGNWPASRGNLFAGGAGGTASLVQVARVGPGDAGARYTIGAWLGGTKTSDASVTVDFLNPSGKLIGAKTIGPAGRSARPVLSARTASGTVPRGVVEARVTVRLATTLTDINGPNAPLTGYNGATAAALSLTLSRPAPRPAPLRPPVALVPRYQHVFLFYLENQDYGQVIGNSKGAPYLNSLRAKGTLLTNVFAEEHPSDANYLAFAGGSAFGVPLDDPAEENPLYTINAANIGDLLTAKGETWKAYTQSADGPCDDTVHGYYWNDDQPMLYFADVRDRPAYCAAHVVPLEELTGDLAEAASTPSLSWIAPDDCSDMEGCGIAAGDAFLKTELTEIMNSPAWRTQRSLAIITFDEDAADGQRPAQHVPTIVLASSGVRGGATDPTRYTHYSLLRTVEAALGLGTLTANDKYAQPLSDTFYPERSRGPRRHVQPARTTRAPSARPAVTPAPAEDASREVGNNAGAVAPPATVRSAEVTPGSAQTPRAAASVARFLTAAAAARQPIAWVANYASNSVTPVNLATRKAAKAIPVGPGPRAITATPNGTTVYVADSQSDTVTPISAATGKAGKPIRVGANPWALAMSPDGHTLYVANDGSGTVTPVDTSTGRPGRPIPVGSDPRAIAMAPDGRTAYVLNWLSGTVTPIATATGRPGRPIRTGAFPVAFAFAPGAGTLYIANFGSDTVTPIDTATNRPGRPRPAGYAPDALAATASGVYAVDGNSDEVTRLGTGQQTRVGFSPAAIAVSGATAYVVNTIDSTVTPLAVRTGKPAQPLTAGKPLSVGAYTYPTAITIAGQTAIVVQPYNYTISLINTKTSKVSAPITVGAFPAAVTVTG